MMKSDLWVSQHTLLETFKMMGGYLYSGNLGFEEAADIDACIALAQSLRAQTGNNAQYDTLFLDEIKDIYSHIDHYRILEKRLEDDRSKQVLDHLLMFRLTRNDQYLMEAFCPDDRQYFSSNFMIYRKPGVFVDCGCLDGASTLEYIDCVPSFHHVYAFEPMHEMNAVCRRNLGDYLPDRITLLEKAVSDKDGIMYFDNAIEGSSHLSETGSVTIETTSLDNAIQESIDYLKMDIEGAEMAALHGAEGHIRNEHPVLAICVYHRPEDLHAIFEYIEGLYPNYKYYLRHHMMDANETVLYAIPEDLNQSNTFHVASEKQNLRDLLLKEFTRVQKTNLEYIRFLLSLIENYRSSQSATLDGYRSLEENYHTALRELEYYQSQYKTEQEAHAYFEQQYLAEQKEHEFYQLQYKAEQEAHTFFEQQYLAEQKEHEFYQLQYKAEQEAHAFFEQQYLAEQKEREFYQLQYKAEQEAHAYFEQQYLAEIWLEEQAALKDARIRELEDWSQQLELESTQQKAELATCQTRISELENWSAELEKGKSWLEQQRESLTGQLHELQGWIAELENAKTYLSNKLEEETGNHAKTKQAIVDLEDKIRENENQIARQRYLLRMLMSDKWIQRIVKYRKYNIDL